MDGMSGRVREGYQGTGPGAITPDRCAVALYERLPAGDEPDIIERAVPARARILELGCGVGRVTHPLAERGFVLIQREGENWQENLPPEREVAGGVIRMVSSEPAVPGVRSVHVEYVFRTRNGPRHSCRAR